LEEIVVNRHKEYALSTTHQMKCQESTATTSQNNTTNPTSDIIIQTLTRATMNLEVETPIRINADLE
jgi:hypothetical protein